MFRITIAALVLSVIFLAYKAKQRRGYLPFWTGLAASLFIITGKYLYDIQFLFYSGVVMLVAASLWNSWPKKKMSISTLGIQPQMEVKTNDNT